MQFSILFQSLNVDRSKGAPAPHKPVLLLSIIQAIAQHEITENKIYLTPELVARFKDNWRLLVNNPKFSPKMFLPFYHLKSEGWWHLHVYPGREVLLTGSYSPRSFAQLKEAVAYASFDEALYQLLLEPQSRDQLAGVLLRTYFGIQSTAMLYQPEIGMAAAVEEQILHEDPLTYHASIALDEEEQYVRSGLFRKTVLQVYRYTCCISGMRLTAAREVQLIDACHIIPFSESGNNSIRNGLSLCPNLHRAFDRYLISITPDYTVAVSPHFTEAESAYEIRAFAGQLIQTPPEAQYKPAQENLAIHFERFSALQ